MRRTLWFRSVASLLAVWLPLLAGEPGLLQPCPMHGAGHAVVASLRAEPNTQAGSHSGHAAMALNRAAEHASKTPVPAHDHHRCTCIDCCTISAAAFIASDSNTPEFVGAEYAVERSVPSVESLARPAPDHSRPYTTGPPRA